MAEPRKTESSSGSYRLPTAGRALPLVQGHDCVVALRALGEETRVRIVGLLIDKPLEVGEIANQLAASAYNVSKHLRVLREAGLLKVDKRGRKHLYTLADAVRRQAAEGSVLDLGCCSFQFDAKHAGARSRARPEGKRPPRIAARPAR
jgi:DNA-binding transcriptional ArsR family regulator